MNREALKEGTDLLDIVPLMTDPLTTDSVVNELQLARKQLRRDALAHANRSFQPCDPVIVSV